ncbi:NADH-quinone oxidoreductase subunit NuoE [Chloroflexota bacterium]
MEQLSQILDRHTNDRRELIPLLQEVEEEFGYLPEEAMLEIADYMKIPSSVIYGVATFYNQFRFNPPGRHPIKFCMGTACHVKGGKLVLEALERELDIKVGETTPDREYSLDRVACIGCCTMAPVMVIDEEIYPNMKTLKVEEILVKFKEKSRSEEAPPSEK